MFIYDSVNLNGSCVDIVGIVNECGNVFGMMLYLECVVEEIIGGIDGLRFFEFVVKVWKEE